NADADAKLGLLVALGALEAIRDRSEVDVLSSRQQQIIASAEIGALRGQVLVCRYREVTARAQRRRDARHCRLVGNVVRAPETKAETAIAKLKEQAAR